VRPQLRKHLSFPKLASPPSATLSLTPLLSLTLTRFGNAIPDVNSRSFSDAFCASSNMRKTAVFAGDEDVVGPRIMWCTIDNCLGNNFKFERGLHCACE
jgi:hypothetical protein